MKKSTKQILIGLGLVIVGVYIYNNRKSSVTISTINKDNDAANFVTGAPKVNFN